MSTTNELKPERLRFLFDYDPDTGALVWRSCGRASQVGKSAGAPDSKGRLRVEIDGRTYAAHHICFAIVNGRWPLGQLDHVNQVKTDNRIVNLREATNQQNSFNRRSKNKLYKGVIFHRGKFIARISRDGITRHLGCFDSEESASQAYQQAATTLHGDFACPKN